MDRDVYTLLNEIEMKLDLLIGSLPDFVVVDNHLAQEYGYARSDSFGIYLESILKSNEIINKGNKRYVKFTSLWKARKRNKKGA